LNNLSNHILGGGASPGGSGAGGSSFSSGKNTTHTSGFNVDGASGSLTVSFNSNSFIATSDCSPSVTSACSVKCNGVDYSLTNAIIVGGGNTQRLFEAIDVNSYQMVVPLCGVSPAAGGTTLSGQVVQTFGSSANIWQIISGVEKYSLGVLTSAWKLGYMYADQPTLRAQFTGGDSCGAVSRQTQVFLICDPSHAAAVPYVTLTETSECKC
jgi:hypothetical protein